jgi:hypothetical protein
MPPLVAIVIPSYRVTGQILNVLDRVGPEISRIYVVDDACPDHSGDFVLKNCPDKRVVVLFNPTNLGVGGATLVTHQPLYRSSRTAGPTMQKEIGFST